MSTGLVDTVQRHEDEVEIERGRNGIAEVEGEQFGLGFFCFGKKLYLTKSTAFMLSADQPDVSQQARLSRFYQVGGREGPFEVVDSISTFFFELYPLSFPPTGYLGNCSFLSFHDTRLEFVIKLAFSNGSIKVSFAFNRNGM